MRDYQALLRLHHRREYYPITRMDWHELNESMRLSIATSLQFSRLEIAVALSRLYRAVVWWR